MKPTSIAVASLLTIAATFTLACGSSSNQTPATTPTLTVAPVSTPTPTPTATPAFITYSDESIGFSMSIPSSWNEPVQETSAVLFTAPSTCSALEVMAAVTKMKSSGSGLQTNWESTKDAIEEYEDYDLISEEDITIDGATGKGLTFTATANEMTIQMTYCMLIDGKTLWVLFFSCAPDCWDTYESSFNTMLNSFEILD